MKDTKNQRNERDLKATGPAKSDMVLALFRYAMRNIGTLKATQLLKLESLLGSDYLELRRWITAISTNQIFQHQPERKFKMSCSWRRGLGTRIRLLHKM